MVSRWYMWIWLNMAIMTYAFPPSERQLSHRHSILFPISNAAAWNSQESYPPQLDSLNPFQGRMIEYQGSTFIRGKGNAVYKIPRKLVQSQEIKQGLKKSLVFQAILLSNQHPVLLKRVPELGRNEEMCALKMKLLAGPSFKERHLFGAVWLPMHFIPGNTLADELTSTSSRFSPLDLYDKAKRQVELVHQQDLYHGDTHAYNFMVNQHTGDVTLVDYGNCGHLSGKNPAQYVFFASKDFTDLAHHVYRILLERSSRDKNNMDLALATDVAFTDQRYHVSHVPLKVSKSNTSPF